MSDILRAVGDALSAQPATLDETRERIIHAALDVVPGAEYASFTVLYPKTGVLETAATTDELVLKLDQMQYEFHEGPCFEAVDGETTVRSDDLSIEERWPRFAGAAAEMGLRSQLAVMLRGGALVAGLNLYSRETHAFEGPQPELEIVVQYARIALGYARHSASLTDGMKSRTAIGQAIGIVRHQYDLDEKRAFEFLTRISQNSNTKLRDVAQVIVDAGRSK